MGQNSESNNEDINRTIREHWREKFSNSADLSPRLQEEIASENSEISRSIKRSPMQYPPFRTGIKVLFVGINPSFKENAIREHLEENEDLQDLYNFNNIYEHRKQREYYARLIELEDTAKREYPFYEPYRKILRHDNKKSLSKEEIDKRWESIDLFLVRLTGQKAVEKIYLNRNNTLNTIGTEEFKIFEKILEIIRPPLIVVANAKASDIIKTKWKDEEKLKVFDQETLEVFNQETGYYYHEKLKTPVIFSSMLSGQRSLDTHTRELLTWHIRKIIKQNH